MASSSDDSPSASRPDASDSGASGSDASGSGNGPRNDTPFSTRPLGRTGSRIFLVVAFLCVIGGGIALASFVVNAAREAGPPPTEQSAPTDTSVSPSPDRSVPRPATDTSS